MLTLLILLLNQSLQSKLNIKKNNNPLSLFEEA